MKEARAMRLRHEHFKPPRCSTGGKALLLAAAASVAFLFSPPAAGSTRYREGSPRVEPASFVSLSLQPVLPDDSGFEFEGGTLRLEKSGGDGPLGRLAGRLYMTYEKAGSKRALELDVRPSELGRPVSLDYGIGSTVLATEGSNCIFAFPGAKEVEEKARELGATLSPTRIVELEKPPSRAIRTNSEDTLFVFYGPGEMEIINFSGRRRMEFEIPELRADSIPVSFSGAYFFLQPGEAPLICLAESGGWELMIYRIAGLVLAEFTGYETGSQSLTALYRDGDGETVGLVVHPGARAGLFEIFDVPEGGE